MRDTGAPPKFFLRGVGRGGADAAAIYNLCLILKIMLQKSCCKYNITLFRNCIYIHTTKTKYSMT
jgi:hypothetical protein